MEQPRYASTALTLSDEDAATSRAAGPEKGVDGALFERFLAGEKAAFVSLFERHHRRLYLYCLKLVGSPEQAEDLVQETWEKLARLRSRAPRVDNPVGFLLKMVRNLSLNHLKREQRTSRIGDLDEAAQPVVSPREPSTEEEIVHLCMAKLQDDFKEVLTLHLFCGYQHDEIAAMLGKSPEAIRKRASRAQQELRSLVMAMLDAERAVTGPRNADRQENR
jgi:RNA polymerase sigma-70 factor (ECF subfamily)